MNRNIRVICLLAISFFALLITTVAKGQHLSGSRSRNDSVPPALYRNRSTSPRNPDSLVQERLVALALGQPIYDVTGHKINIAEDDLAKAKRTWLNLLSVSANFNDQDFAKNTNATTAYVYPKYYFGVVIPIGLFFSMGPDIKSGREGVAIARDEQLQLSRTIRADVLTKYAQYREYTQLIGVQNSIVDDEEAMRKQTEQKFKDGTIGIEQYNMANKAYSDDLTKKLNQQLQQDLIKIDLEKMIGVPLESVLNMK